MTGQTLISAWTDTALSFLYPEVCQLCREEHATAASGYVGEACWREVRFISDPFCERCGLPYDGEINVGFECENCRESDFHFKAARSAVTANELVLDVIHRYKYSHALWFEPFLADLLIRRATPFFAKEKYDLIVPVPLHPAKQREREFNQAERLARCLSGATNLPVNTRLLKRIKATGTQTRLTRAQRSANMEDAFAVARGAKLAGERIVLFDDVFTTGATTSACAKMLTAAGAGDVCVWTVARGL